MMRRQEGHPAVTDTPAAGREIPVSSAVLEQLGQTLAAISERLAARATHTPDPNAPLFAVIDHAQDFAPFTSGGADWRTRVAEIHDRDVTVYPTRGEPQARP
jgi:hypothetical protein